jgi:hypothetical protein
MLTVGPLLRGFQSGLQALPGSETAAWLVRLYVSISPVARMNIHNKISMNAFKN